MNDSLKEINVKTFWWKEKLVATTKHIVEYKQNRNPDYFQEFLYVPFLTLINYHILRIDSKAIYYQEHDDWISNCFGNVITNAMESYNIEKNAYSYFGTCIKNNITQTIKKRFLEKRDIRKEVHYDAATDEEKNAWEPVYEEPAFIIENDGLTSVKNEIDTLKEYLKVVKFNDSTANNIRNYIVVLKKLVNGELVIPEECDNPRKIRKWLMKESNITSSPAFTTIRSRIKYDFRKYKINRNMPIKNKRIRNIIYKINKKRCKVCGEYKRITAENWHVCKSKTNKFYFIGTCKTCTLGKKKQAHQCNVTDKLRQNREDLRKMYEKMTSKL